MSNSMMIPSPPPPSAPKEQIYLWDVTARRELVHRVGTTNDRINALIELIDKKGVGGGNGGGGGTSATASTKDEKKFLANRTFTDLSKLTKDNIQLTKEEMDFAYKQIIEKGGVANKMRMMVNGFFGGLAGESYEQIRKGMIEGSGLYKNVSGDNLLQKYFANGKLAEWLEEYKADITSQDEADALGKLDAEKAQREREADFQARNGLTRTQPQQIRTQAVVDGQPREAIVMASEGFTNEIQKVRENTTDMLDVMTSPNSIVNSDTEYLNLIADTMKSGLGDINQALYDLNTETLTDMVGRIRGFNEGTFPTIQIGEKSINAIQRAFTLALQDSGGLGGGGMGLGNMIPDIDMDMPDKTRNTKGGRSGGRGGRVGGQVLRQGGKQVGKQVAKQGAKVALTRGAGAVAGATLGVVAGVAVAGAFTAYELYELGKAYNEYSDAKEQAQQTIDGMNQNILDKADKNFDTSGAPYWIGTSAQKIAWIKKNKPQLYATYKGMCIAEAKAQIAKVKYDTENDYAKDKEADRLEEDWKTKMKARVAFKKSEIDPIAEPNQQGTSEAQKGTSEAIGTQQDTSTSKTTSGSNTSPTSTKTTSPTPVANKAVAQPATQSQSVGVNGVSGVNGVNGINGVSSTMSTSSVASGGLVGGSSTESVQTNFWNTSTGMVNSGLATEQGAMTRMMMFQKWIEDVLIPKLSSEVAQKLGTKQAIYSTPSQPSKGGGGGNTP